MCHFRELENRFGSLHSSFGASKGILCVHSSFAASKPISQFRGIFHSSAFKAKSSTKTTPATASESIRYVKPGSSSGQAQAKLVAVPGAGSYELRWAPVLSSPLGGHVVKPMAPFNLLEIKAPLNCCSFRVTSDKIKRFTQQQEPVCNDSSNTTAPGKHNPHER